MKKICLALVIIFVLTVSVKPGRAIVGYAVAAIVGASAIVAGSSLLIPAMVNGPSNKSAWVSLGVTVANVASLSASIALQATGLPSMVNALKNYVSSVRGPSSIVNGIVGYMKTLFTAPIGHETGFLGWFSNSDNCWNTINALGHGVSILNCSGGWCGTNRSGLTNSTGAYCLYGGTDTGSTQAFEGYTSSTLGSSLATDIAAGNVGALNLAKTTLNELNENMQGTSSSLGSTLTNAGKTILNNSVTQAQADTIAGVTPKTPEEIAADAGTASLTEAQMKAAMIAALSAQGLSNEQIQAAVSAALALNPSGLTQAQTQAAVKTAIDDATGVTEPVETTTVAPTRLSLTTVMGSFMASINALPGLTTLRGLHVNCGGSSVLCLSVLGAQGCYDAAQIQGLDTVGSTLFGLVSLVSFVGIFRG